MSVVDFEHPIQLYHETMTLEDWLANFSIEVGSENIELPPPDGKAYRTVVVAKATYLPTTIEGMTITRENLVSIFSEAEVVEQELEASYAYLDSLAS